MFKNEHNKILPTNNLKGAKEECEHPEVQLEGED